MVVRVIVTGSRHYPHQEAVWEALYQRHSDELTVVHGACPTGADLHAHQWFFRAESVGAIEEPHPAQWETCTPACYHRPGKTCPAAGPRRNQEMVDLGADICLAFPWGESRGTMDCVRRARKAGIPVVIHA